MLDSPSEREVLFYNIFCDVFKDILSKSFCSSNGGSEIFEDRDGIYIDINLNKVCIFQLVSSILSS